MNNHTLDILEFPRVIEHIRSKCLTPFGAEHIEALIPLTDKSTVTASLDEVTQMKDIINFGSPFPIYRQEDCRPEIEESVVEGHFLDPKSLLLIRSLVQGTMELYKYEKGNRENFRAIDEYLSKLRSFPELKQQIEKTIDIDGVVKDNASSALRSIRVELNESKHKIQRKLQQIVAKQPKQPGWQDDIVTMRNERYVIGVPTSNFHNDMGILHDRSQSGATFFIEPKETVELNNRINLLYREEQQEIVRLLKALTKEVADRSEALLENCRLIGMLDKIHACALFSNDINGTAPIISDQPMVELKNARHPLLIKQLGQADAVIPNSLLLDETRQAILITGPNTGGKTVLLKTVGLSVAMALAGLHISVDPFSKVGLFSDLFADIGDEQSLELSLSTFSSHIRNIITGLENANDTTLLLYDEIGAGTDPREGAALAEAIILHGLKQNTKMIVTTHYSQLKTLATEHAELENGSLDFDKETLSPTYKLRIGIPGSSYAIDIARRLGLPESICDNAAKMITTGEKSLDKLIGSLENDLNVLRQDKAELTEKLTKAAELESYYKKQTEHLEKEVKQEKEKALKETQDFLTQTRKNIERLVADIRSTNASEKAVKAFHASLKAGEQKVRSELATMNKPKPVDPSTFDVGDTVEIISLKQSGEIEEIIGNEKARIKIGNMFTTAEIRNLRKLSEPSFNNKRPTRSSVSYESDESGISREIHLRGLTAEEALERLERFLDQATISGLSQVYVIHGKGAGVLRRTLTDYLKNRTDVASIRLGDFNEGGLGVTVVKLKD